MSEATFDGFPAETAAFLRGIAKNNDKKWFEAHRADYEAGYVEPAKAFVTALGPRLKKIAPAVQYEARVNGSLFRINRDVRFGKDKRPYKDHLDLWFWCGDRRGWDTPGFFFRMFADRLMIGAGMHRFEKSLLDAYRKAVVAPRPGRALAAAIDEVRAAGHYEIGGASRKTVPRGFDADHERAPLLLHEGLWAGLETELGSEAKSARFVDFCAGHYRAMWPVARWTLKELTTRGARGR
jgi:uncharacterized protein (TIGR02453 family)